MTLALTVGCKAYYDTFSGLVPVKVTALSGTSPRPVSSIQVDFEVTEDKGPYRKGERLRCSSLWVIPKKGIYTNSVGQYRISHYQVGG